MAKELDPQEKALLSRVLNRCSADQVAHAKLAADIKNDKNLIRTIMTKVKGLDRYETDKAVAVLSWPESRSFDVALIEKIVDAEDLEVVAPRKVAAAKLDEVIGHHKYEKLETAVAKKKAKTPSLEVRQVET